MTASVKFTDVLYFLAEVGVYVAIVWWAFTRDLPTVARWLLGLGLLIVFAASWGLLAAPKAAMALHGLPDVLFRLLWFGLGLAAAIVVITEAI